MTETSQDNTTGAPPRYFGVRFEVRPAIRARSQRRNQPVESWFGVL
jgi:hypothetical protein